MDYRNLGRTGLRVSPLCLGTMNFGSNASEEEGFAVMDKALELGVNFFDSADVYGGRRFEGYTEQIIGKWLSQGGGRRERIVLATKVHNPMGEGPNDRGLSAYHIRKACDDSLRRLKTDRIDLYQFHHIDRATPWEEIWQAMEQLTTAGKVLYAGSSNFPGWGIAEAQGEAKARGFMGLVCEQSLYNLSQRTVELEVIPACRRFGLGLIPWSPLGGGVLAGVLQGEQGRRRRTPRAQEAAARAGARMEAWERLCAELGKPCAVVALAWLLKNPVVTAPIVGPRSVEQLTGALEALDTELDDETMARLDEIWPGPGGEAPEAYAW